MSHTQIVGHRGASGLVQHENTLEAFARTADVGADWVELDVRRLGDGTLVVLHDPVFDGVRLERLDLADLQARAAERGFSVPTLYDALDACRGRIHVDIELKEIGTETEVADIARALLPPRTYVYTSFHDRVVAGLKLLDPEARAGLLLGHPDPDAPLLTRISELFPVSRLHACGADFVAPNWCLVRAGFLGRVRRAGFPVWVWTVNQEARLRRLLRAGVEAVITDRPDLGVRLREDVLATTTRGAAPALAMAATGE